MQITNTTVTGYISFMESVRLNIYNDYSKVNTEKHNRK